MTDRPVVFLDLDDTLFSSLRKLGPGGEAFEPVAYDRGGVALSFMSPRQRAWFDWLRETTAIVPTTGRNLDAFRRVHLPFDGQAILSHGGLIIRHDGNPDPEWHRRMCDASMMYRSTLGDLCSRSLEIARDLRSDVRGRVISDAGINLYCSIKHNQEDIVSLAALAGEVRAITPADWTVHLNDNNLAIMPPQVSKAEAVQYVLDTLDYRPPFVIGIGDSVSDLPFLANTDLAILPGNLKHSELSSKAPSMFSGSYLEDDVSFLLTAIDLHPTETLEKERLIQSGARHYSEMISRENPPSPAYLELFHAAFARNRRRFAGDVLRVALALKTLHPDPFVLVSLARAGTPVGVLLRRALGLLGVNAPHYSISIIRDRGIDDAALDFIRRSHPVARLVFVDGWTGKGAISIELERSLKEYNDSRGTRLEPELAVVADLSGLATLAASSEDYLIPTAILNAVVSGLISRTILNEEVQRRGEFHGCVIFEHLSESDLSRWVVDELTNDLEQLLSSADVRPAEWNITTRASVRNTSVKFLERTMAQYNIKDPNRVKPGIGEATRAMLRRVPDLLLVQEDGGDDLAHLLLLANTNGVPVQVTPDMPYRAAVIIKSLGPDT